jgi:hypothetical protein
MIWVVWGKRIVISIDYWIKRWPNLRTGIYGDANRLKLWDAVIPNSPGCGWIILLFSTTPHLSLAILMITVVCSVFSPAGSVGATGMKGYRCRCNCWM